MTLQAAPINKQAIISPAVSRKDQAPAGEQAADRGQEGEAVPQEQYEKGNERTIPQAFKAVSGAITRAASTEAGATGSLRKTDRIGSILRTALNAVKAVAGAAAGAFIGGPGLGSAMIMLVPDAVVKTYENLIASNETGMATKITAGLLLLPAAALAPPVVAIGGTVYGIYRGLTHDYNKDRSFKESVINIGDGLLQWNEFLTDAVYGY